VIRLKVELVGKQKYESKYFITCPQCSKKDYFFTWSPLACEHCGFKWGDLTKLLKDIKTREQYHVVGKID